MPNTGHLLVFWCIHPEALVGINITISGVHAGEVFAATMVARNLKGTLQFQPRAVITGALLSCLLRGIDKVEFSKNCIVLLGDDASPQMSCESITSGCQ
jgi:hypothetical protein